MTDPRMVVARCTHRAHFTDENDLLHRGMELACMFRAGHEGLHACPWTSAVPESPGFELSFHRWGTAQEFLAEMRIVRERSGD